MLRRIWVVPPAIEVGSAGALVLADAGVHVADLQRVAARRLGNAQPLLESPVTSNFRP